LSENKKATAAKRSSAAVLPIISVLAAAVLWGTIGLMTGPLSDAGVSDIAIIAVRALVTSAALGAAIAVTDRSKLRIRIRDIWMFIGGGVCSFVFFNICYLAAIRLCGMTVAAVLLYTAPIFVTLMSAVFLGERLSVIKLLALPLCVTGCVFVCGSGGAITAGASSGGSLAAGIVCGVLSGFGYALYSIFGGIALRRYDYMTVTFWNFVMAAAVCLPWAAVISFAPSGEPAAVPMGTGELLLRLLVLGVVTGVLPYMFYTYGLSGMEASRASVIACAEPVTAAVLGTLFGGDSFTVSTAAGIALVLGAVVLISIGGKRLHSSTAKIDKQEADADKKI